MLSKIELKKQLIDMGAKIKGNYVLKSDIEKLALADKKINPKPNMGEKKEVARYLWFIVRSQGDWKDKIETGYEDRSDAKDYLNEIKEYDKGAKIFHRSKVDPEKLAEFFKAQGVPQRMLDKGYKDAKKDAKTW